MDSPLATDSQSVYSPLNRECGEIRILRLLASADRSAPIVGRLGHVSLLKETPYQALSYTWGETFRTEWMTLNGKQFAITSNLFAALKGLRDEKQDLYIWVDAVCINQEDDEEKALEVLRMRQIYEQAFKVNVWLGKASRDSQLAIQHLRVLNHEWRMENDTSREFRYRRIGLQLFLWSWFLFIAFLVTARNHPFGTAWTAASLFGLLPRTKGVIRFLLRLVTLWCTVEVGLHTFRAYRNLTTGFLAYQARVGEEAAQAVKTLFERSWFFRIWAIQEVVVARNAVMICGMDSIPWEELCNACDQMQARINRSDTKSHYKNVYFSQVRDVRLLIDDKAPSRLNTPFDSQLLYLLVALGHFEASNPRDKIYALLGLAEHLQFQSDRKLVIEPNYRDAVSVVYADLARAYITQIGRLDVLRFCEGSMQIEGLPSWTPDWSYTTLRDSFTPIGADKSATLPSDPTPDQPVAVFSPDGTTMTVRGFIMGHLDNEGEMVADSRTSMADDLRQFFPNINVSPLVNLFLTLMDWLVSSGLYKYLVRFFISLALRLYPEQREQMMPYINIFQEQIAEMATARAHVHPRLVNSRAFPHSLENLGGSQYRGANPSGCREAFWTSHLKTTTLKPDSCFTFARDPQPKDLAVMLIGAHEPYILRPHPDFPGCYKLVGSATFQLYTRPLWSDCCREHADGTLPLQEFAIR